jgi:hypothetical protein
VLKVQNLTLEAVTGAVSALPGVVLVDARG